MNHLNPAQTEQLKEIGAYLRQLRQEQSISTEEVAAKTVISLRILKALEEGQPEHLPEAVFIQGFIRRYADVLDLDGAALAKTFPTNFLPVTPDTCSQKIPKSLSIPIQIYVLYVLLLLTAVSGLLYLLNKQQTAKPNLQNKNSPVIQ